jgi:hypothetical protein
MDSSIQLLDEALANVQPSEQDEKEVFKKASQATKALATVINYVITDAFGLKAEESVWVGYHLNKILKPLRNIIPTTVLISVDQEMYSSEYSNRLMSLVANNEQGQYLNTKDEEGVRFAPLTDWVEWVGEVILFSYPTLRPMIKSAIIGSVYGLFQELGLSEDPKNSRASLYLPNSIRFISNQQDV